MKICMYSIDSVFEKGTGGVRRFLELINALVSDNHEVFLYSADTTESIRRANLRGCSIFDGRSKCDRSMIGLKSAFGNRKLFTEIRNEKFDRVVVFDVRAAFSLVVNGIKNLILFIRQDMYLYKKIQLEDNHANSVKKRALLSVSKIVEGICLQSARKIVLQCSFDLNGLIDRHHLLSEEIMRKSVIQINNVNPSWIVSGGHK